MEIARSTSILQPKTPRTCCDREFGANGTCAQDFAVDRLQNFGSDSSPQAAVRGNQTCARNSDCPTNLCAPDGFCAVVTTGQSRAIDTIFIQPF
jgi:hypothetical protein